MCWARNSSGVRWLAPSADARRCTTRRRERPRDRGTRGTLRFRPLDQMHCPRSRGYSKSSGDIVRCSRDSDAAGSWLEFATWMLRPRGMRSIRVEKGPCVHMAALSALIAVIRQPSGDQDSTRLVTSNALISGVTKDSHGSNRRVSMRRHGPIRCSKHSETDSTCSFHRAEPTQKRSCQTGGHCQIRHRHTLIGLLNRLVLDHARSDHHPQSEEAAP